MLFGEGQVVGGRDAVADMLVETTIPSGIKISSKIHGSFADGATQ